MPARKRKQHQRAGSGGEDAHSAPATASAHVTQHPPEPRPEPPPPVAKKQDAPKSRSITRRRVVASVLIALVAYVAVQKVDEGPIPDIVTSSALWETLNATLQDFAAQLPAFNISVLPASHTPIGETMAALGYRAHHPVVIVPGFVTSGLELWEGKACGKKYFRQRMWGTMAMAQQFLLNKQCWLEHMALDPITGLDPPGVRLRAANGLEAVDFFVQGYWVWSKLIEALAQIGYDNTNLVSIPYDWRLALPLLQARDSFYTRTRATIESLSHSAGGVGAVVVAHSMGESVFRNFLAWAEEQQPGWTQAHVAAFVNVAGPVLGVPKALTSLLSGETRDTADLAGLSSYLTDNALPRTVRAQLFRSWGAVANLLPTGGPAIWGNGTWAPDDDANATAANRTFGTMLTTVDLSEEAALLRAASNSTAQAAAANGTGRANTSGTATAAKVVAGSGDARETVGRGPGELAAKLDAVGKQLNESATALRDAIRGWLQLDADGDYHLLPKKTLTVDEALDLMVAEVGEHFNTSIRAWSPALAHRGPSGTLSPAGSKAVPVVDPLQHPLPAAPGLKVYCLYGVGIPTERAYHYYSAGTPATASSEAEAVGKAGGQWAINEEVVDEAHGLDNGVQLTDGDGTVPLISLGLMCRKGWRSRTLNPAGFPVVTREYQHRPEPSIDMRGGGKAADHVSVLGHDDLLVDVIKVASGRGAEVANQIFSDIDRIADRTPLWDDVPPLAEPAAEASAGGEAAAADASGGAAAAGSLLGAGAAAAGAGEVPAEMAGSDEAPAEVADEVPAEAHGAEAAGAKDVLAEASCDDGGAAAAAPGADEGLGAAAPAAVEAAAEAPDAVQAAPQAGVVADEAVPHAGVVADEAAPHAGVVADEPAPHAGVVADEAAPQAGVVADEAAPQVGVVAGEAAPQAGVVAGEAAPQAGVVADEAAPQAGVVAEEAAPQVGVVADEAAPRAGVVADEAAPQAGVVADEAAPQAGVVADEAAPQAGVVADEAAPHAGVVADEAAPHDGVVADEAAPVAEQVLKSVVAAGLAVGEAVAAVASASGAGQEGAVGETAAAAAAATASQAGAGEAALAS